MQTSKNKINSFGGINLVEIYDNNIMRKEWENFISNGRIPYSVSSKVLRSWERSNELGVNPYEGKSNIILSKDDLLIKLNENKKLIDVSKSFINKIYQNIKGCGYLIFLTDNQGNLLHTIGDKKVLEAFNKEFNFMIGASWSEEAVGTTAVSMVLSEENSIPFMSEEKFCYSLKNRACSAVPIRNIDNKLMGVLGVAASFADANNQIYGILIGAQMAIENQLRLLKTNKDLSLISNYYKSIFYSVSDAIIAIDNKGIITDINKNAEDILNSKSLEIIGKKASEVLNCYPIILDVLKSGEKYSSDNSHLIDFKDKKYTYNLKSSMPIYGENNKLHGSLNIIKKIENPVDAKCKKNSSKETSTLGAKYCFSDIIGISERIQKAKSIAKTSTKSMANVLIFGESGTGKEYFAQAIHNASNRGSGPFVDINCGAIPKELIESEFFGYEGGSFTGARKEGSLGKFELASGGTIFLDEIGEMSKDLQIRLLRILQEREVIRIGGTKRIPIDVKVIAATNKDLLEEVNLGNFRKDLYWRLNVLSIHIPTLEERQEDIPLLAEHFIKKYSNTHVKRFTISNDTMDIFLNYNWPGNVRELENCIERAILFVEEDIIYPSHLPEYIIFTSQGRTYDPELSLNEIEKKTIEKVLLKSEKNLTKAAKLLGISRPTLYSKLKKYDIIC
jgi:transcriptional regulator with PAS, ATPase and Fis domain